MSEEADEALAWAGAGAVARGLASGDVTSAALVDALLARIERLDGRLHAFVRVFAEEARGAAQAADRARAAGHAVGRLHGVPVAVKDIVDIEGTITTGGCKAWEERVSPVTATIVERMRSAGLVVLGKTHTVEFAMGSFGTNTHMGTPWNPWDRERHRAPGGSSAGTAVAVAAGLAPWGIGTDTGGSVRIPASWCGLVGLKTTIGEVSRHGVLPLSQTLDTVGPLCRSVEDAAALFEVLRGRDPHDASTRLAPERRDTRRHLARGVDGLVLARLPADEREGVDDDVLAAYDESLERLGALGAIVVDRPLPRRFADLGALVGTLIGCEGYAWVGDLVDDPSLPLDDDVRPRIRLGRDVLAREYLGLLRERDRIRREFEEALEGVDALLTPTTTTPAPLVAEIDQGGTAAHFTRAVNLVAWCALSVPNGVTGAGLPTSLQIVCKAHDEATALRVGAAHETTLGPWRRPDVRAPPDTRGR